MIRNKFFSGKSVYIAKSISFLCILTIGLHCLNYLLMVKDTYANSGWPVTSNYATFYQMDKDSIDLLFLGSSVEITAFDVQQIYNDYGITSYSMGSGWQSPMINYYWLKEAYKTQSPKVVVLDSFTFFRYSDLAYNMPEAMMRKPVDAMRWSLNKWNMVADICKLEPTESLQSFIFTNIRYHNRWKHLDWTDLDAFRSTDAPLKGYAAYIYYSDAGNASINATETDELMMEYVDKIKDLCAQHDTKLILVTLPGTIGETGAALVADYAAENNLDYYNMNTEEVIAEIGAVEPQECIFDHENLWGSEKTTAYFCNEILSQYDLPAHEDDQYEASKNFYDRWCKSYSLFHEENYTTYLEQLNDPAYTIYDYVNTDGSDHIITVNHEEYNQKLIGHNYVVYDNVLNKVIDVSLADEASNRVIFHEDIYAESVDDKQ